MAGIPGPYMKTEYFDLFPTRVWVFYLEELLPFLDQWTGTITQWRASDHSQGSSNRQGWTSEQTVFQKDEFRPLRDVAERCFAQAYEQVQLAQVPAFRMKAWVNLQDHGGFNHFHAHGKSALAGAFYVRVPEGSGDIVFRDPRAGINLTGMKGDGANCFSVTGHTPRAGELVIFPGWLEHAVDMNVAPEARISIAVNSYLSTGEVP